VNFVLHGSGWINKQKYTNIMQCGLVMLTSLTTHPSAAKKDGVATVAVVV
jgi:hypothetical protein